MLQIGTITHKRKWWKLWLCPKVEYTVRFNDCTEFIFTDRYERDKLVIADFKKRERERTDEAW
jgi:hypothetical protein